MVAMASVGSANPCAASADAVNSTSQGVSTTASPETDVSPEISNDATVIQTPEQDFSNENETEQENENENTQSTDNDNVNLPTVSADTNPVFNNDQSNSSTPTTTVDNTNNQLANQPNLQNLDQSNTQSASNTANPILIPISGSTNSPTFNNNQLDEVVVTGDISDNFFSEIEVGDEIELDIIIVDIADPDLGEVPPIIAPTFIDEAPSFDGIVDQSANSFATAGNSATQTNNLSNAPVGTQANAPLANLANSNTTTVDNSFTGSNSAVFGPIRGATVDASNTQSASGDNNNSTTQGNTNSNAQSNTGTQTTTANLDNDVTFRDITPTTTIRIDPAVLTALSSANGGTAIGGECSWDIEQRTGDTGDVNVEATSGNVTQGDVTGGDGGDTYVEMGVGGDGGGGGAAGGSGHYAGAVIGNNNGGGGGGPGGPGGAGSCEDCSVVVTDSNNGGGAEGGTAESGSVEVDDVSSGDSGDNTYDASIEEESTKGDSSADPESGGEEE